MQHYPNIFLKFFISILFILSCCAFAAQAETVEAQPKTAEAQVQTKEAQAEPKTYISRSFSLGGWLNTGNTESLSLNTRLYLSRRKRKDHEITVSGSVYHSSYSYSNSFRLSSSLRYTNYINKKFHNYYKMRLEFSSYSRSPDDDIRLIPVVGIGYSFSDDDDYNYRFDVEGAIGFEKSYIIGKYGNEFAVLELGSYLRLGSFTNDFDIYFDILDFDNYRLTNRIYYRLRLNKRYSLVFSLRNEHNNRPYTGYKKDNAYFSISLQYYFYDYFPRKPRKDEK
jgi:hypothetical protein